MIVFCHLLNDNSGSPTVLRETIKALSHAGPDDLLFVGSQGRGVLENAGIPIRRYWYRRGRFRLITLLTFLTSQYFLYRALSRARLPGDAIFYVNTLLPFGAALWAKRNGHIVLYHAHEATISPSPLRRFLVNMVEKTAERVLYVSNDHMARLPIVRIPGAVVPNPIAPRIAAKGSATPYAPRRTGYFLVLMLASPRDFKGVHEFLALAELLMARQDIRFQLVLNADAAEIERYLPAASRPHNLEIVPRVDDPERFYATADVLLNLTRVDLVVETFGLTLVEAMAFGVPVIAPPVGGPAEIVTHRQEGYCIDSRDGTPLQAAVLELADNPDLAMTMSQAARNRASEFTFDAYARKLRRILAEAQDLPTRETQ
ncbi:glycosyltransferase family 4 protein [Roseovarius sp. S4756]|uniref:glycosyltransferase family 4 protein n=1 Tax=Roseovarius maritimus TaxID=3342637 RepID=UPI0037273722